MDRLEIDLTLPRRTFTLRASLTVGPETVALTGPSGAGKTSLLRSVAGLEHPIAGRVSLGRTPWLDSAHGIDVGPEHRRVGYLPQDYGLFPHMSVAQNVRFAAGRDRPDLLERIGIAHLARARPRQLSGGERQRVALARALARQPRVLLLDEPFAALDAITRERVRDELHDLLSLLRLPTLLVTHAFSDAAAVARRIAIIDEGRLVQVGPADELLRRPANAVVAALMGANVVSGSAERTPSGCTVRLAGGGELVSASPASGPVEVAVHPWDLRLADPRARPLTDRVLAVQPHDGRLLVRLSRFRVDVQPRAGQPAVSEGSEVGLDVAPERVLVFQTPSAESAAVTSTV